MATRSKSDQQIEIRLQPAKTRRMRTKAPLTPEALTPRLLRHNAAREKRIPVGTLLSWADPRWACSELSVPLPTDTITRLLHINPPLVLIHGGSRTIVGNPDVTCALLNLLPKDTLIDVIYVDPSDPLSRLYLPLHTLLSPLTTEAEITIRQELLTYLTGTAPTDQQIAKAMGRERSTITKLRQKMRDERHG